MPAGAFRARQYYNPDPRIDGFLRMITHGDDFKVEITPNSIGLHSAYAGSLVITAGNGDIHVMYRSPFPEDGLMLFAGCLPLGVTGESGGRGEDDNSPRAVAAGASAPQLEIAEQVTNPG